MNDYSYPFGGAEIQTLAIRDSLQAIGHDARIFASSAAPLNVESRADYHCFGTMSRFRTLLQTANPSAYWRLHQVLNEFQPDLVHVRMLLSQISPLILPLLNLVPSLYHVVWYRPICPTGIKLLPNSESCGFQAGWVCYQQGCVPLRDWVPVMLQLKLWQAQHMNFRMIIANSEAVRQRLRAEGIDVAGVLHNLVPLQPERPPLSSPPMIAFAGRLVKEKGIDVAIRATARIISRLPLLQFWIAGDGPEKQSLIELVNQLRLTDHVRFLGHLSQPELACRLASAWVQVVPSRWAEPFGNITTEAMMRGTAVVATACGGSLEIVKEGKTGFLVPPGDDQILAERLLTILTDQELAERLGRAGRQRMLEKFGQDTYLQQLLAIYQKVLEGARNKMNVAQEHC